MLAGAVLVASGVSYAQGVQTGAELDKNMELMRKDLRSGKKQVIAANLPLTDVEATKFWPVYDQYVSEMSKQYDQFYGVIKDYAANQKTLTDPQALGMIKRWSAIQVEMVKIKQKYIALVEKVIPGKKTALFFQLDRRLYAIIDLQIASEIPLVMQQ
jgi:hypothetical protein